MGNNIPVTVEYRDNYLPIHACYDGYLLYHDGLNGYYVTPVGIAVGDDPFEGKSAVGAAHSIVPATLIVPFKDVCKLKLLLTDLYSQLQFTIYRLCRDLGASFAL